MQPASVSTSNDGVSTSYVLKADTLDAVNAAIAVIERQFHPLGYGTSFRQPEQQPDGSWKAWGSRSNSCD